MTAPAAYGEFSDFGESADAIMRIMHALLGLELWLVVRVHEDEWNVLHAFGSGPFRAGDVLPLRAMLCNELLLGNGPNVAPDVTLVPAYARAPITRLHVVGSYAGAPLVVDGSVYGLLCGMSSGAASERTAQQTPHLIAGARTLSTILGQRLRAEELARRAERAENDALVDALTGLYNRRGWEQLVRHEEARGRRYGNRLAVFFMDIDGLKTLNDVQGHDAGDIAIVRTAEAIRSVVREHDVAARIGGDEFALLAIETDGIEAASLGERLANAFRKAGVSVSIGFAPADMPLDLAGATRLADEAMYRSKAERNILAALRVPQGP